jgi:hypothetical protein
MIVKLDSNVYVVRGKVADVGVNFGNTIDIGNSDKIVKSTKESPKHVPLGVKDETLFRLHELASKSPNKWALMETRKDFLLAEGIQIYTRVIKDGVESFELNEDPETIEIEDWIDNSNYKQSVLDCGIDLVFSGRYYKKLTLGLNGKPEKIERVDIFHCRPVMPFVNETRVMTYALNANFGTKRFKEADNIYFPAFDPENPAENPVSIIDVKKVYPGQVFHTFAEWWGTEDWTVVTNKIPKFHNSGLDNGYNIKYHISVPDNYFRKEVYAEGENEETLKVKVLDNIGDTLAGIDNVDKALFTFHKVFSDGKFAESGIKITALPNPMSDDAYTKLFNTANAVQASGHRVMPVSAGIDTGGGLGTSGKELEASANYQQAYLTYNDRQLLLKDFYYIKKMMGWNRNKFARFKNVQIYTADTTPTDSPANPNNPKNKKANADK